jgi:hypothetical protein
MSIKRINEFPVASGVNLTPDDIFLMMDDPSGSAATKKVSLATLSSFLGNGGGSGVAVNTGDIVFNGSTISSSNENGSVTISASGNQWGFNTDSNLQIPGNILLNNGTSLAKGTFDNNTGGQNGISLNCAVGYELNWQGGRLKSTYDNGVTASPIYVDSPMSVSPVTVEMAYNSTINVDAKYGDMFDITLTGNATLANPTNPVNGKTLRWRISQDSTGGRTITLGNKFNIPSSASSPLPWSTSPNKMDILAATYHAGRDKWDVIAFVPGY